MKEHSRRSFVKTSAATGLTFTFAGLIRAHGQSGGDTTWNPEFSLDTTFGTDVSTTWNHEATYVATTWPGHESSTTWDPLATATTAPEYTTCDPNAFETTAMETESVTTTAAPIWKKRKWNCRRVLLGPSNNQYTPAQLQAAEDSFYQNNPGALNPPAGPPPGALNQGGPFVLETWDEPPYTIEMTREPEHPVASNVLIDGEWYAALVYDYVETKYELDPPTEP